MRDVSRFSYVSPASAIPRGRAVAVRSTLDGHWSTGFAISDTVEGTEGSEAVTGYILQRHSDGEVLPAVFPIEDIIPAGR